MMENSNPRLPSLLPLIRVLKASFDEIIKQDTVGSVIRTQVPHNVLPTGAVPTMFRIAHLLQLQWKTKSGAMSCD